jgi:hypothetical protein
VLDDDTDAELDDSLVEEAELDVAVAAVLDDELPRFSFCHAAKISGKFTV